MRLFIFILVLVVILYFVWKSRESEDTEAIPESATEHIREPTETEQRSFPSRNMLRLKRERYD